MHSNILVQVASIHPTRVPLIPLQSYHNVPSFLFRSICIVAYSILKDIQRESLLQQITDPSMMVMVMLMIMMMMMIIMMSMSMSYV